MGEPQTRNQRVALRRAGWLICNQEVVYERDEHRPHREEDSAASAPGEGLAGDRGHARIRRVVRRRPGRLVCPGARLGGRITHKGYEHLPFEMMIEEMEPE